LEGGEEGWNGGEGCGTGADYACGFELDEVVEGEVFAGHGVAAVVCYVRLYEALFEDRACSIISV
jgi:hypothetical protein